MLAVKNKTLVLFYKTRKMKKILVIVSLCISLFVHANNHTIVVRGEAPSNKDVNTVVSHGSNMTNARFRAFIDHEIATFDNDIYMCTQEESVFIASLLSIADSSGDWWNTHPEANPNQIPAVAVDAGGAIVSGLIGIISGNASWQGIATSAISASTGAAAKVGSVLVKIAKWAKIL